MTRFSFPYARVVAPAAEIEWAQRDNLRWFGEQGLLDEPATAGRYERWYVALLAGLMYPHARGTDLALATHVLGLLFLIDDEFESPLGVEPWRAVRVCEELMGAVRPPSEPAQSGPPLVRVARLLWLSARIGMPPPWCGRTAQAWEAFAGAPAIEAFHRRAGTAAPWESFRILRRFSGGADLLIGMAERVEHYTMPALLYHSPQIQRMLRIATEVPVFTNDANSLEKERHVEVNNLVTAARQYHGLSAEQAIGHVVDVVSRAVQEFAELETSLSVLCRGLALSAPEQHGVDRYVESMRHMMRGYHEWELRTARYLDARTSDPPGPASPPSAPRGA
jgi:pentalenene synthase/avermitilol synthase